MTMKAVGTAAMEMVQEVEIQFDEVGSASEDYMSSPQIYTE